MSKIMILTNCSNRKKYTPDNKLTKEDFHVDDPEHLVRRKAELAAFELPAYVMYKGRQHNTLIRNANKARALGLDVSIDIVSAGFGLLSSEDVIVPYDYAFEGMKETEQAQRAHELNLPTIIRNWFEAPAPLKIVILGKTYLNVLRLYSDVVYPSPTIFIVGKNSVFQTPTGTNIVVIPVSLEHATRFSESAIELKSFLTGKILHRYAQEGLAFWDIAKKSTHAFVDLLESTPDMD